jgi:hypothetical protein
LEGWITSAVRDLADTVLSGLMRTNAPATMPLARKITAGRNLVLRILSLAYLKETMEPDSPVMYSIKPDMKGAAALIQG